MKEFIDIVMMTLVIFIGLPALIWLCSYMMARGVISGVFDTFDLFKTKFKKYEQEKKK